MHKEILDHHNYVLHKLEGAPSVSERKQLSRYHHRRVRDFQHERLVHLLVTLFFAAFFLGSLVAYLVQPYKELQLPLGLLTIILFILELAYLRHYYQLENGVQSLYKLTEKLNKLH